MSPQIKEGNADPSEPSSSECQQSPCSEGLPQSWRCSQISDISSSLYLPLFREMLAVEKKMWPEWYVFYHSYASNPILYELYSGLAKIHYGVDTQAPLPRVFGKAFRKYPSLNTLLQKWPGTDHQRHVKRVLISAQPALFSTLECQPVKHFAKGYCSKPAFSDEKGMEEVLDECGCDPSLAGDIVKLWKQYYTPTKDKEGRKRTGHMLQIFVHRDVVDEVAYSSRAYGEIDMEHHPLSKSLLKEKLSAEVQVRLYTHPAYFTDRSKVRLHYFCAEPSFSREDFRSDFLPLLHRHVRPDRLTLLLPKNDIKADECSCGRPLSKRYVTMYLDNKENEYRCSACALKGGVRSLARLVPHAHGFTRSRATPNQLLSTSCQLP